MARRRGPYGAANILGAREYLAGLQEFRDKSSKTAYELEASTARRLANAFSRQQALGVPLSYPAARGHVATPEHAGRTRLPTLEVPVEQYRAALGPEGYAGVAYGVGGEVYHEVDGTDAVKLVQWINDHDTTWGKWGPPLVMSVRDETTNRLIPVFQNWHGVKIAGAWTGIQAGYLLDAITDNNGRINRSLESFVLDTLNNTKSGGRHHIGGLLSFQITALSHPIG
jgi:hypothetical protein